jgi:hypothetical protein
VEVCGSAAAMRVVAAEVDSGGKEEDGAEEDGVEGSHENR